MTEKTSSPLAKWPFVLADLLLLAAAGLIVYLSPKPLGLWQAGFCLLAVAAAGWFSVLPFLREHEGAVAVAEADRMAQSLSRLQDLDKVRSQIENATGQWQTVQDHSRRTVEAATKLSERMAGETREFCAILDRVDQTEKGHLKLELEKARRAEAEWLQTNVRILDQIFALHQAALQSGHPALVNQIGQFQAVCRDVARRVGLVAFAPESAQPFDEKSHSLMDEKVTPPPTAMVYGVVAPGYSFQGRLLRKAIVAVDPPPAVTGVPKQTSPPNKASEIPPAPPETLTASIPSPAIPAQGEQPSSKAEPVAEPASMATEPAAAKPAEPTTPKRTASERKSAAQSSAKANPQPAAKPAPEPAAPPTTDPAPSAPAEATGETPTTVKKPGQNELPL